MSHRTNLLRFLLCALPLGMVAAKAAPAQVNPEFSAESQDYNIDTGETLLHQATVTFGEGYLTGDEVSYNTKTGIIIAKGHVVFTRNNARLLAEEITYSINDGTYIVKSPRIGSFPVYLRGTTATGDQQNVIFHDAQMTYGEPGLWVPTLSAKSITYQQTETSFHAKSASAGIAGMRFLPLPSFKQTAGVSIKSFLSLQAGYRSSLGAFIDAGVRLPVAPGFRLGADVGYFTSRGLLFGPAGQYDVKNGPDSSVKGAFRTGYINDHGNRETDVLGRPVPEQRSFITWQHQQKIGPDIFLDAMFNDWRDSEVMRDFRRREFHRSQTPDSYLETGYVAKNYQVSLFGRFHPNPFHDSQERLPELRFDLFPVTLFEKVYQRLNVSYARLRDNPADASVATLETDRADAYYALTRNFTPREWLGVTLVAGARSTHYTDALPSSGRSSYTRNLAEFGFDSHLSSSGTFAYKNERWGINGLRHLLTPFASYRYIPEAEKGARYIPRIDRQSFNTYLQPLGLGAIRHIDDLHAMNTLRVGVSQRLQTRDADYGSRDLASLTVANDFNFERSPGERKVAETHADLALMPARWLRFDAYTSFEPQSIRIREVNTGLVIHDGEEWALRLATHYLNGDLSDYSADYTQRLNEVFSANVRFLYDGRAGRMNEHAYGLIHTLDRIWQLRYELAFFNGPRREGSFEFRLEVEARGF